MPLIKGIRIELTKTELLERKLSLGIGSVIPVKWSHSETEKPFGEIMQINQHKQLSDRNCKEKLFYVHYLGKDRRLDEWVSFNQLDIKYFKQFGNQNAEDLKKELEHHDDEEHHVVRNIHKIQFGKYEMDTWYFSPYPKELLENNPEKKIYICEYCLKYMQAEQTFKRHVHKCDVRAPPGNEIYRDGNLSIFELDGSVEQVYCENLSLISKLFLDHKTLHYDVDPFLFYVMAELDDHGYHIVGYFSKEKLSQDDYNLACIMTLPCHQRKGYGNLLIQFSYALSHKEKKSGTPERPLSDLGRVSYESYWKYVLVDTLLKIGDKGTISVKQLGDLTRMKIDDIVHTLEKFNILQLYQGKFALALTPDMIKEHMTRKQKLKRIIDGPKFLHWTPHNWKA